MISHFARRASAAFLFGALCTSCEDPEPESDFEELPIRYVTNDLEIATSFEEPLCEGDLRWLDAHTRQVAQTLGVTREQPWTVYVYTYGDALHEIEEGVAALKLPGCAEGAWGCFRYDQEVAIGVPFVLDHELVHMVASELGPRAANFWNEGIAEALSLHAIDYAPSDLVAESMSTAIPSDYRIPGHFVRWLMEWRGVESILRMYQGEAFAAVYGMELDDVVQIYDTEAAEVLPSPFACEDEMALPPAADGSFDLAVKVGCGEPTTTQIRYGFDPGLITTARMIEIAEPTTYKITMEGARSVFIGGCQAEPSDRIDQLGDVVNETWTSPVIGHNYPIGTGVGLGEDVFLPAWTYRVIVVSEDRGEPVDVRLRLTPL